MAGMAFCCIESEDYETAMMLAYSSTQDEWNSCVEAERVTVEVDGAEIDVTGGEED